MYRTKGLHGFVLLLSSLLCGNSCFLSSFAVGFNRRFPPQRSLWFCKINRIVRNLQLIISKSYVFSPTNPEYRSPLGRGAGKDFPEVRTKNCLLKQEKGTMSKICVKSFSNS